MTVYVLLRIDDKDQAEILLEDMLQYPDDDLLTPCQENFVHAELVSVLVADGTADPVIAATGDEVESGQPVPPRAHTETTKGSGSSQEGCDRGRT